MGVATRTAGTSARVGRSQTGGVSKGFRRELGGLGLTLMALGGIMGSGIFLGSGLVIQRAGPAALLVFALAALAMFVEVGALVEMASADPVPGSFLVYAQRVLGPAPVFVTGWVYWFSSVLTMSSEVTAAALFMRLWLPTVPIWIWSLLYSAGIVGVNFLSVGGLGRIESVMALVKAAALLGFAALGLAWVLGWVRGPLPGPRSWAGGGPFWPHGVVGAAPSLLLALFAYAGTGVLGMAAAEVRSPAQSIPRAGRAATVTVTALYLSGIFFVLALQPWYRVPTTQSPFVAALQAVGWPVLASVMNVALLCAVLSTMNAALYANVRVLYSLARQGHAPRALSRLDRRGQPSRAIWTSAGLLLLATALAYILPHKAYAYLITATGVQAMFIWWVVLQTQLRYRPYLLRRGHPLPVRMAGYPWTSWFGMAVVGVALAASPLAHGELVGVVVGFGGLAAAYLVWRLWGVAATSTDRTV